MIPLWFCVVIVSIKIDTMPHRCAFGCMDTNVVMHVFPNPEKFPERFLAWVKLVGGTLETLSAYDIYKKKRICDIHFINEHRNRFKRLNALALPSLHLPGSDGSTAHLSKSIGYPADLDLNKERPTTSGSVSSATHLSKSIGDPAKYVLNKELPTTSGSVGSATHHFEPIGDILPAPATTTSDESLRISAKAVVSKEHNYSILSRPQEKKMQKGPSGRTPFYQTKLRYLRSEISRLRKKGQSLKERLAKAEKMTNDIAFKKMTKNMTKTAKLFLQMQLQCKNKPKGRRFSIEEKVLSLSLFKKSPKSYKLLSKYFTLPSSKAMKRLLSRVKLTPGLNDVIFDKIKKNYVWQRCSR